jgi:aldehyde dehydrogenase (NAD+)
MKLTENDIFIKQKDLRQSGKLNDISYRKRLLKNLFLLIKETEPEFLEALKADLGKPEFEAYGSEVGVLLEEIKHAIKNIRHWTQAERVPTPLVHWPAKSFIFKEPLGNILIISPWNYPVMLALVPAVSAIAAGNTVCIKPSEFSPKAAAYLNKICSHRSLEGVFLCVEGEGAKVVPELIASGDFNHVFFTGSEKTGSLVYRAAAEHMIPVTLELGGKSPCIVDQNIPLKTTARRIVWSKFYNSGQTCVAPDYLLVHAAVEEALVKELKVAIYDFFGSDPKQSNSYARIHKSGHLDRLGSMLEGEQIIAGGEIDSTMGYMQPTLVKIHQTTGKLMKEEIFGPILPIMTYKSEEEIYTIIASMREPLALYVYSKDSSFIKRCIKNIPFGGGMSNGGLVHLANMYLPFGGIGKSGFGCGHGKFGFDQFSHKKAWMHQAFSPDIPLRYPPYGKWIGILRRLMG